MLDACAGKRGFIYREVYMQYKVDIKDRMKIRLIQNRVKPESRTGIFYTVTQGAKQETAWQRMPMR